jgi:hypothetical protein
MLLSVIVEMFPIDRQTPFLPALLLHMKQIGRAGMPVVCAAFSAASAPASTLEMGELSRLTNAKSRSISSESPTGEKGMGAMSC